MKKASRIFAVVICLAMLLTVSAFAAWDQYQGNSVHNGQITDVATPYGTNPTITNPTLNYSGTGWSGVDTTPVMETVSNVTYSYVVYNGRSNGIQISKINCNTSTVLWSTQLSTSSGNQLSSPCLDDDYVYVGVSGSGVYKVNKSTGAATLLYSVSNQINTPIVKNGNYLYFGTWVGNGTIEGSDSPGRYYQLNLTNLSDVQSVSSIYHGFYWAGATIVDSTVYFGGDGGYLYYRPAGSGFGTTNDTDIYNTSIDLSSVSSVTAGNVRSSLCYYNGYLYFTSQGGYLWRYSISAGTLIYANIGGTSTSTPVISTNGYIYVGSYGSNATKKGVRAILASSFTSNITSATDSKWVTIYEDNTSTLTGWVQCSVIVYSTNTYDYVYFTTNVSGGKGLCYRFKISDKALLKRWETSSGTYTLQGMAACGGYLTFGNDADTFYVIH